MHALTGLKRTGKSCRLRWLNYLRPDVRRGNITPEEQLLIMELHAKWGNRYFLIFYLHIFLHNKYDENLIRKQRFCISHK